MIREFTLTDQAGVPVTVPIVLPTAPATSTASRLAEFILSEVKRLDWVSFAELVRRGEEAGFTMSGETSLSMGHVNTVLWTHMSEEYFAAVQGLLEAKAIHLWPASGFTYCIDGIVPGIPEAKGLPRDGNGYKKPRWLPVCLRTVPCPAEKEKGKKR